MKIQADRLRAQLAKSVAPLYILSTDEPLLLDEALAAIREAAVGDGCTERETRVAERGFDWDEFAAGLQSLSLFASRRLVELRLPTGKPGEAGARFLNALAQKPDTGNVVVLLLPGLDSATSRSRWASALATAGIWVDLRPPQREQLPGWLRVRLKGAGLTADDESLDLLASRVEGNLLAAKQEIDKLALMAGPGQLTAEAIRESVADGARFDIFQLSDAALAGDMGRAVRVLAGLRREGEPEVLVLWSLARDVISLADIVVRVGHGQGIDQALNDAGIWRSRRDAFGRAARGRGIQDVRRLLDSTARADQIVKGARRGSGWNALLEITLELCGARLPLAETA